VICVDRVEGEFWLVYKKSETPKKCTLGVKFPNLKSRFYITLGGRRATELYNYILLTLDTNRIEYSMERVSNRFLVKLPWSTGLAITLFLLTVYSNRKPLTHAPILNKMLNGEMPLMKHLTRMIELALDLTDHLGEIGRNRLVSHHSARTVSKIINKLISTIKV